MSTCMLCQSWDAPTSLCSSYCRQSFQMTAVLSQNRWKRGKASTCLLQYETISLWSKILYSRWIIQCIQTFLVYHGDLKVVGPSQGEQQPIGAWCFNRSSLKKENADALLRQQVGRRRWHEYAGPEQEWNTTRSCHSHSWTYLVLNQ